MSPDNTRELPFILLVLGPPPTDSLLLHLSNFNRGSNKYSQDLLALEQAYPPVPVSGYKKCIISPLHLPEVLS